VIADPYRWQHSLQLLEGERLPMMEYPQSAERLCPATARFYEAVMNHQVTAKPDARMSRHLANCVLKVEARGSRIVKESKGSHRRIDLAVAAVMAFDRVAQLPPRRRPRIINLGTWRPSVPEVDEDGERR
jgi:phage terminase large subunit-like protein